MVSPYVAEAAKRAKAIPSKTSETSNMQFHRCPNWQEERGPKWLEDALGYRPGRVSILVAIVTISLIAVWLVP